MASGRNWAKAKDRRKATNERPAPLTKQERSELARKNVWNLATWRDLRARTQALADAAAPKPLNS
jgi:hypothetical protein